MNIHKNARLTVQRRGELAALAALPGANRSRLARRFEVSRQTVGKWAARYAGEGPAGLRDRSSRPHRSPRRLARVRRRQIERRRRRRWSSLRIARDLHLPIATVVREQRRIGLHQLARLDPPRPANRYEWPHAGDLLHLDVKKLVRIGRIGHRIHGDWARRTRGLGWEYVHVAIDDATRAAYVEILPDERGTSTTAFLERAVRHFAAQGVRVARVMTDNGPGYLARVFRAAVLAGGARHVRTRPYTPRTNGKAERFIRTLLAEWAYAQAYRNSFARALALPRYLGYYHTQRPHLGLRGLTPQLRLAADLSTTS